MSRLGPGAWAMLLAVWFLICGLQIGYVYGYRAGVRRGIESQRPCWPTSEDFSRFKSENF